MKIYSLLVVKNEADIITSTLTDAARWSDKVLVLDNGSTDDTWRIIQDLSKTYTNIIPFAQDFGPFHIGLRARMFDAYKNEMTDDDWWCFRLDADEFFIDDPRTFLANIPKRYKLVWKESYDFKITYEDLEEFTYGATFEENKDKIKYYEPYTWSEARFLRHSDKLVWNENEKSPARRGMTYGKQIRVKHYQVRNPIQMQHRHDIRQQAKEDGCGSFKHENGHHWKDYLRHRSDLFKEEPDTTLSRLGARNKHNRPFTRLSKFLLTLINYY